MLRDRSEAACCSGELILITTTDQLGLHHDATAATDQDIYSAGDANYKQHLITTTTTAANPQRRRRLHLSPSSSPIADGTASTAAEEAAEAAEEEPQSVLQARLTSALLQILRDDKPDTPTQVKEI